MKYKIFISICICLIVPMAVMAQENLKIKGVFDRYGKQEGSTLVQLSSDILSQGSNITFYKSMVTNEDIHKEKAAISAINSDSANGTKISEIKKNGKIESGTYFIGIDKESGQKEYILYKNKSKKLTVVYLKGNFSPQQLDSELQKLKDLFIYVNNKRLKIQ